MLALTLLVGLSIWITPPPQGVTVQAWHLFAIFVATIFGMIAKPLPMGAVAFSGLTVVVLSKTLPFATAFSGFSNQSVWLIVFAFFVARGFIKTGLGMRLSYLFVFLLGKSTLGLGYGVVVTDVLLAPAIPSSTARTGGVILPIIKALARAYDSKAYDPSSALMGTYLMKVAMQSTCVSSAMFLTAMAANPLIVDIASGFGIEITWGSWALAAIVPGLISSALMPWIVYKMYPPEIKQSPEAPNLARAKLAEMGPVSRNEWVMLGTFIMLIFMWMFAQNLDIKPAVSAMFGLVILLVTEVLTWDDIRKEEGAWETLVWFAILMMMATQLSQLGFTTWFSEVLVAQVHGFDWYVGFTVLSLTYLYSHYLFAGNLSHVGAMYATFLGVSLGLGTPPILAALVLGFFSSLFSGLTQYSCGPAAILFGAGYVRLATWWKVGFVMSVVNVIIWLGIGSLWWKLIGLW
ncbi:MAG: anion permease [Chlamydiota bacterium]|nr:anion permease [Chlamydiota bacterium]